jgi:hypothetical protein
VNPFYTKQPSCFDGEAACFTEGSIKNIGIIGFVVQYSKIAIWDFRANKFARY